MKCSCMKAGMSCVSAIVECAVDGSHGTESIDAEEVIGNDEEETDWVLYNNLYCVVNSYCKF